MTCLPSLSWHGLCNVLLCESLSGNHPGRKTHPCPSSDVQIAADLTSNPKFTEVAGVRANFIHITAWSPVTSRFSGRKLGLRSASGAGPLDTSPW